MDLRIKTTDYEITPEVSDYLDERIAAIEKLLGDSAEAARCEVEIGRLIGNSKHGNIWFAEINVMHQGDTRTRAVAKGENVNAAIDEVKSEITNQLRKQKQLHRRVLRRGGATMKWLMRFGSDE